MLKEKSDIPVKNIRQNNGQLSWLPKNPRQWTQTDIDRTVASIQEDTDFLEDRPLLLVPGPKDGQFIVFAGNLRYTAAKKLNMKTVPAVLYYPDTEEDQLTVKRRAMKDNGTFGAWDVDALANQWDDLPLADWGIDVPGFDTADLDKPETPEAKDDEFDEDTDNIPVRCNPGDIWQLGEHRLMCGDSTDVDTVKQLMDGCQADISFTSPPYNAGDSEKLSGNTHFEESKYKNYDDDNVDYKGLILHSTMNAMSSAKYAFVNLQLLAGNKTDVIQFLGDLKDKLCDILIWRKTGAPAMASRVCNSEFEFIFVFSNENNSRAIGTRDFRGTESNVFDCSPQRKNEFASLHAATFSVEFVSHYITSFSNEGESVLDLFGGTGTTMIAAEQLHRRCFMMELDPHYCDVILTRWETLTGKTAQLIKPGEKTP